MTFLWMFTGVFLDWTVTAGLVWSGTSGAPLKEGHPLQTLLGSPYPTLLEPNRPVGKFPDLASTDLEIGRCTLFGQNSLGLNLEKQVLKTTALLLAGFELSEFESQHFLERAPVFFLPIIEHGTRGSGPCRRSRASRRLLHRHAGLRGSGDLRGSGRRPPGARSFRRCESGVPGGFDQVRDTWDGHSENPHQKDAHGHDRGPKELINPYLVVLKGDQSES